MRFRKIYVEISNLCNLRCAFCPGTTRPPRYMTAAEFAHIARALRPCTDYLYLHVMGEPLLHPELEDILSIAQGEGFRLCLTTNGTLLPRRAPLLLSCDALHKVSVSLHSFEGNDGGDIAPYLEGVWDFAAAASTAFATSPSEVQTIAFTFPALNLYSRSFSRSWLGAGIATAPIL